MPSTPPPDEPPDRETSAGPAPDGDAAAHTEQIAPTAATESAAPPPAAEAGASGSRPSPPGSALPPGYPLPSGYAPPPGYGPLGYGPPASGYPFAPVARVPWTNPQRRGAIIGTAIGGALILLLAGIGIGYAVAPDGRHGDVRMERPYGGNRGGIGMVPGPDRRRHPNRQLPVPPQLPSSAPSAPSAPSNSPSR